MRNVVGLLISLALACQAVAESPSSPLQRRERIQHVFRLCTPYEITGWDLHEDGGSVSGEVIDLHGNKLSFSIASGMRAMPLVVSTERQQAMSDSITAIPTDLYIGHYQEDSLAEKLEIGSEREKALLDLLDLAAVDQLGTRTVSHLDSLCAAAAQTAPSRSLRDLPVKAALQYTAHQTAVRLREQRRLHVVGWHE